MSLAASMLVGAVILFRIAFRKTPRYIMCILWALVGLRLICPITIQSSLSLIPSFLSPSDSTVISDGFVEIPDKAPIQNEDPGVGEQPGVPSNPETNAEITPPQSPSGNVQITAPKSENDVLEVCSVVWLYGAAAMLAYTVISYALLKRKVAASVRVTENIYECDNIDSPFILGVINPKIYLPSELSDGRDHVIAHERAHIKRLDYIWKPLGFLILSVYWFNPVIWLAYVLLCRDIELACDEKVVRLMDSDGKRDYSTALLSCSVQRKMISACPLAFGETDVKQRIKSVLSYKKPTFWIIIGSVAVSLVITVCFTTFPLEKGVPFFSSKVRSVSADNTTLSLDDDGNLSFGLSSKSYTPLYLPANAMTLESETEAGWQTVNDAISEGTENADLFTLIERGNSYTVEGTLNPEAPLTDGARYRLVTTAYRHYPTKGTAQPTNIYVEFTYAGGKISTEKSYVYNLPTGENTVRFDPGDYEFLVYKEVDLYVDSYVVVLNKKDSTFATYEFDTSKKIVTDPKKNTLIFDGTYTKNDDTYHFTSYDGALSATYRMQDGYIKKQADSCWLANYHVFKEISYDVLKFHKYNGMITLDTNGDGTPEEYVLSSNTDIKRAVLSVTNNYDYLYENIKPDSCIIFGPSAEEVASRFADFDTAASHPIFARDSNGDYFVVLEHKGKVHKYSFSFNGDTVRLDEDGKQIPFSKGIGYSTRFICNSLPDYENTVVSLTFHSGSGAIIRIEGEKSVEVRGMLCRLGHSNYRIYTEDGKHYDFCSLGVTFSSYCTMSLMLTTDSKNDTIGEYKIPVNTIFRINGTDDFQYFYTGVYEFTDKDGNVHSISLLENCNAVISTVRDGKSFVVNGLYSQAHGRLYLSFKDTLGACELLFSVEENAITLINVSASEETQEALSGLLQDGVRLVRKEND